MLRKISVTTSLLLTFALLIAQDVQFDHFLGTAYHIPVKKYNLGYGEHVHDYEEIAQLQWDQINVSERNTDVPFPDIPKNNGFGIYFTSTARIEQAGCYEFSLNSDDGSKLWIEDTLVIDNGGNHQMQVKIDTLYLNKGQFNFNIWYQQLYPTKYGLIFDAKQLDSSLVCLKTVDKKVTKLTLGDSFFFDFNSYKLKRQAIQKLDSLATLIKDYSPENVTIIGHTDNKGSYETNLRISELRAKAIADYFLETLPQVKFTSSGAADTQPVESNETDTGRSKNRRVEITLN